MTPTREAALEAALKGLLAEIEPMKPTAPLVAVVLAAKAALALPPDTHSAGQLEMERKVLAVMSDLLVASDLLNERWKARSKIVSARLFEHAATMQTIREALAARPDPQPAADTRVVTVAQLERWAQAFPTTLDRGGYGLPQLSDPIAGEARAIIEGKDRE